MGYINFDQTESPGLPFNKPPSIIEDHPIIEDPPILEDPPEGSLHGSFVFSPAEMRENFKKFDGS